MDLLGEYFSTKKTETGNFLYGNLSQWSFGLADNLEAGLMIAGTLRGNTGKLGVPGRELPIELRGGKVDVHVYEGVLKAEPVYVGITNNLANRQAAHGERFVLNPLTSTPVTRGEARAIEQARIVENPNFQNIRNSVSPKHSYYQQAVDWGKQWLRSNGF